MHTYLYMYVHKTHVYTVLEFSITGLKLLETNLSVHEEEEKEVKTEYREAKEMM